MKTSTKRNLIRWFHLAAGSILAIYIYSPIGQIYFFQILLKTLIIPLTTLSGLWLWKGHLIRRVFGKRR